MRCAFPSQSTGTRDELLVAQGCSLPSLSPAEGSDDGVALFVLSVYVAMVNTSSLCFPSTRLRNKA